MLWIWRGEGWAVLAIYVASLTAVILGIVRLAPGGSEAGFAGAHAWPLTVALGLARHSLYFIPVEYWGAVGVVGAALCLYFLPA
jgi:hypothetical protein